MNRVPLPFRMAALALLSLAGAMNAPASPSDLATVERRVELQPDNANAQFNLGLLRFQAGDVSGSVAALGRAVALAPSDAELWDAYGRALVESGRADLGAETLTACSGLGAGRPELWITLGIALDGAGRGAESLAAFESALQSLTRNARAKAGVGMLLRKLGRPKEGLLALEEAHHWEPDNATVLAALLRALNEDKDYAAAESLGPCADLPRSQKAAEVAYNLGYAGLKLGHTGAALAQFERAVAADPTLAPAYHSLGFLYYGAGDLTRSAAAFATVLRLTHGSHAEARYNLGVVLGDLGRWDEAAADYRAALELDPGNADLRRNLDFTVRRGTYELIESGTGAYMRGDFALAAQEWDRAAALDPANETAAALAAKAHLKIGPADPEPATGTAQAPAFDRVATKAEEAEDRSVLAQGLDLLALGRLAEASAPLAFYHRGHPDDAAAATAYFRCRAGILTGTSDLMREAQLALEAGDAKAAVRGFEKVLALDPGNPVAREMAEKLSPHTAKSRLNPEDARRRYIEGVAQYMKGRLPEAAAIWGALVKDDPADMEARRSLARVQAEMRALRSRGGA